MTLSPAGVLTGTPDELGAFSFTIKATDENGCTGLQTVTLVVVAGTKEYTGSEGATGEFFDSFLTVLNFNDQSTPISVNFTSALGRSVVTTTAAPNSRLTLALEGLARGDRGDPSGAVLTPSTPVATTVTSTNGLPLVVEETMFWATNYGSGHAYVLTDTLSPVWYFAEGSEALADLEQGAQRNFMDTYMLAYNPNATPANVTVEFLFEDAPPSTRTLVPIVAGGRRTEFMGHYPELAGRAFGMIVTSD